MTIGIFGGSFDPPHVCHVLLATYALATKSLNEVWVVPCFAHAFGKQMAPFEDRVRMCERAFALLGNQVKISDIEQRLGQTSYTRATLEALIAEHPQHRFALLLGSDNIDKRHAWRDFDAIERMVEIVSIPRDLESASGSGFFLPDISSTDIRRRLALGESVADLVPAMVIAYLEAAHLYGART